MPSATPRASLAPRPSVRLPMFRLPSVLIKPRVIQINAVVRAVPYVRFPDNTRGLIISLAGGLPGPEDREPAFRDIRRDLPQGPDRGARPALGDVAIGAAVVVGGACYVQVNPGDSGGHELAKEMPGDEHAAGPGPS